MLRRSKQGFSYTFSIHHFILGTQCETGSDFWPFVRVGRSTFLHIDEHVKTYQEPTWAVHVNLANKQVCKRRMQ